MRLIDGDEVLKEVTKYCCESCDLDEVVDSPCEGCLVMDAATKIKEAPTVDAEPVRHGRWIFSPDHAEGICTLCNFKIYGRPYNNTYLIVPYNYCPNCGAKMDGGRNERY